MKKQFVLLTLVSMIFLISIIYKEHTTPKLSTFPLGEKQDISEKEIMLYLFIFFARNNCPPCLRVIELLNQPAEGISVIGLVPEKEQGSIDESHDALHIKFPIKTSKQWRRFLPKYTPSLYGVGRDGQIYFVLPCVGTEDDYLLEYISEFKRKAAYLLLSRYLR